MRVLSLNTLVAFWTKHPETKASLTHWYNVTNAARWRSTADVMASFPKASVLSRDRVRFEVAGGNYRMIVAFWFDRPTALVKFIGTHKEYDDIPNVTTINLH